MTAYGIPGFGIAARTVMPNHKCEGCLHYDRNRGQTGLCLVGLQPFTCGDGDFPAMSYAPVDRAGPNIPPNDVEPARSGGDPADLLHGVSEGGRAGDEPEGVPMEHVFFEGMGLDSKGLLKSIVDRDLEFARYGCLLHQNGPRSGQVPPGGAHVLSCSCRPVDAAFVAKSFWGKLPNRARARCTYDEVVAFVEKAMLPVKAPQGAAKKPPGYLPGVHSPSSPMRPSKGDMGNIFSPKKPAAPKIAAPKPMAAEPTMKSEDVAKGDSPISPPGKLPEGLAQHYSSAQSREKRGDPKAYDAADKVAKDHVASLGKLSSDHHAARSLVHHHMANRAFSAGKLGEGQAHSTVGFYHTEASLEHHKGGGLRKSEDVAKGLEELEGLLE